MSARICGLERCDVDLDALEMRPQAIYCCPAHKAEAARIRAEHQVGSENRTETVQDGSAGKRKRRPDMRVSYRRAVLALADEFGLGTTKDAAAPVLRAARVLEPLLSDRQREALR